MERKGGLQQTYNVGNIGRADFVKDDFSALINEKGRRVIHEKALQCPCKSSIGNQLSSCLNCGGIGWVYINPIHTEMVLSAMRIATDVKPWSEEARGTVNVSCKTENELAFMDRLTVLDARAYFLEVLFLSKKNGVWFSSFSYSPYSVFYAGIFVDGVTRFTKLVQDVDFTVDGKYFKIINEDLIPVGTKDKQLSITVRYLHAPLYYILEMGRETMETFELKDGKNVLASLPVSAVARKAHYVLKDKISLGGQTLLINDFVEDTCHPVKYNRVYNMNQRSLTIFVKQNYNDLAGITVEGNVFVRTEYPPGDTITIPHLINKRVLRPIFVSNATLQIPPYDDNTGTLSGGYVDEQFITLNYIYNE